MGDAAFEKIMQSRIQTILDNPTLMQVYRELGGSVFRRSSVFYGLEDLLRSNFVFGKHCVEIGTFNAITAVVLSEFFDHVTTFDILPNTKKAQVVNAAGKDNITLVDVENNAEKAALIESLEFDCAYLDGDHAHDTWDDFDLVKRCGRVIFDEYWPQQKPVMDLVDALKGTVVIRNSLALWKV